MIEGQDRIVVEDACAIIRGGIAGKRRVVEREGSIEVGDSPPPLTVKVELLIVRVPWFRRAAPAAILPWVTVRLFIAAKVPVATSKTREVLFAEIVIPPASEEASILTWVSTKSRPVLSVI